MEVFLGFSCRKNPLVVHDLARSLGAPSLAAPADGHPSTTPSPIFLRHQSVPDRTRHLPIPSQGHRAHSVPMMIMRRTTPPADGRRPMPMQRAPLPPPSRNIILRMLHHLLLSPCTLFHLLASLWLRVRQISQRGECELCCTMSFLISGTGGACEHRCCSSCWQRYFSVNGSQLAAHARRRLTSHAVCCWGCTEPLERASLSRQMPSSLIELCNQLDKRADYVARGARRSYGVVQCTECDVGIGYDDGQQATAMCFLCEQYAAAPDHPPPAVLTIPPLPLSLCIVCSANGRWSGRPRPCSSCVERASGSPPHGATSAWASPGGGRALTAARLSLRMAGAR